METHQQTIRFLARQYRYEDHPVPPVAGDPLPDDEATLEQERPYKDTMTKFVVANYFREEEDTLRFIDLVVHVFDAMLDEYATQKKMSRKDLKFIYKGGNVLRAVHQETMRELPAVVSETLQEFYSEFFKQSDADFSIYINPALPAAEFDRVATDLANLAKMCLIYLRHVFDRGDYFYFPRLRPQSDPHDHVVNQRRVFQDCVATLNQIGERQYTSVSLGGRPDFEIHRDANNRAVEMTPTFVDYYATHFDPKDQPAPNVVLRFLQAALNPTSAIVVSNNSSLDFGTGIRRAKFILVRSKFYFKTTLTNGTTRMLGGELIDVSIPSRETLVASGTSIHRDLRKTIKRYQITSRGRTLRFESYSIESLVEDLRRMLFVEQDVPWNDAKYEKRLNRLVFLYILDAVLTRHHDSIALRRAVVHAALEVSKATSRCLTRSDIDPREHVLDRFLPPLEKLVAKYGVVELLRLVRDVPWTPNDPSTHAAYARFIAATVRNLDVALTVMNKLTHFVERGGSIPEREVYDMIELVGGGEEAL
jgi:hypothetical protein